MYNMHMKISSDAPLSMKTKLGFGICDVGGNLFFTVIAFHLAVYLTDTRRSGRRAHGRRPACRKDRRCGDRSAHGLYLRQDSFTVGPQASLSYFRVRPPVHFHGSLMFSTPALSSQLQLFLWVAVTFSLLSTAYTVVNIPYGALTPELTRDFNERTVLNGYRMSFAVVGTLIGAECRASHYRIVSHRTRGVQRHGVYLRRCYADNRVDYFFYG